MRKMFLVAMVITSMACASFQSNEFKGLEATDAVVTVAMNAYGDAFRAHKTTPDFDAQVKALYGKYQKAVDAVVQANVVYDEAIKIKADTTQAAEAVTAALAAMYQAVNDLITLTKTVN